MAYILFLCVESIFEVCQSKICIMTIQDCVQDPIGMCKIRNRDDNGVAQGDWSKTKNYSTVNKL